MLGVCTSLLTSWLGVSPEVRANARPTDSARDSIVSAFRVAFLGGSIMGLAIISFSLLILSLLFSLSGVARAGGVRLSRWLGDLSIFLAICAGIAVMFLACFTTRHYAGMDGRPVRRIAEASRRGDSVNIITGLSHGLRSLPPSIVGTMLAMPLVCWLFLGRSPLSLVAINIGEDLMIASVMAVDAFGPITDNAAGIAEMSGESGRVVFGPARLDAVGNTMRAMTKAYADASGTLTAFIIFTTFLRATVVHIVGIWDPWFWPWCSSA